MKLMKNLRVFLLSLVKTTKSLLKVLVPLMIIWQPVDTGQLNTDLIDWQQQTLEEAIKEVVTDTSSVSQAVNVASDDDVNDQEKNTPWNLTTSQTFQHLDDFLHFSMMKNDATLTGLIGEVTDKIQNIRMPAIKQSNIWRLFSKSWIMKDKILMYTLPLYFFSQKPSWNYLRSTLP